MRFPKDRDQTNNNSFFVLSLPVLCIWELCVTYLVRVINSSVLSVSSVVNYRFLATQKICDANNRFRTPLDRKAGSSSRLSGLSPKIR